MLESFALSISWHMVQDSSGDALPCGLVFVCRAQAQQSTEVFHSPEKLSSFVYVEAIDNQSISIPRYFRSGAGEHPGCDLHAEVFVECSKRQLVRGTFDDVPACQQRGLFVWTQLLARDGCV